MSDTDPRRTIPERQLGSELNCSGFKQINEDPLNATSTHANALVC